MSTRIFFFVICLCDTSFGWYIFFFIIHLFLLTKGLPPRNYTCYIRQNLKDISGRTSVDMSGSKHEYWLYISSVFTLLRASLYCCRSSSVMSCVYPFELCHSDFSKRYSIFFIARFKMKFIMEKVVSCTAVLASCWIEGIWKMYNYILDNTMLVSVSCESAATEWLS